jgi:hypothetical protein
MSIYAITILDVALINFMYINVYTTIKGYLAVA